MRKMLLILGLMVGLGISVSMTKYAKSSKGHLWTAQAPSLNMPGPRVQNLMLGTWAIKVNYEPNGKMPNGGVGHGTEIWRPGPGGHSVIEELHENGDAGEVEGFAIAWWEPEAEGQRFVWCENNDPKGCVLSKSVAKWEGDQLVYTEVQEQDGERVTMQEIFSEITAGSFTQVLLEAKAGRDLKPIVTIHASKRAVEK